MKPKDKVLLWLSFLKINTWLLKSSTILATVINGNNLMAEKTKCNDISCLFAINILEIQHFSSMKMCPYLITVCVNQYRCKQDPAILFSSN